MVRGNNNNNVLGCVCVCVCVEIKNITLSRGVVQYFIIEINFQPPDVDVIKRVKIFQPTMWRKRKLTNRRLGSVVRVAT